MNWFSVTLLIAFLSGCASSPLEKEANVNIAFPPKEPIVSAQQADAVLDAVALAQEQIEWRYKKMEQICYERFFVNSCLLDAKNQRRTDLAIVKKSEVEANRFKRKNTVEEMDRALVREKP